MQALLPEGLVEHISELQVHVSALAYQSGEVGNRNLLRIGLIAPFRTQHALGIDGCVVQQFIGHLGSGVAALGLQQVVGDGGVVVWSSEGDAVLVECDQHALDVVAHDARRAVEDGGDGAQHLGFVVNVDETPLMLLCA